MACCLTTTSHYLDITATSSRDQWSSWLAIRTTLAHRGMMFIKDLYLSHPSRSYATIIALAVAWLGVMDMDMNCSLISGAHFDLHQGSLWVTPHPDHQEIMVTEALSEGVFRNKHNVVLEGAPSPWHKIFCCRIRQLTFWFMFPSTTTISFIPPKGSPSLTMSGGQTFTSLICTWTSMCLSPSHLHISTSPLLQWSLK